MEENTQDIRQLAKLRLQEIHAQMYVLSEEARIINGFLTLRDQEETNTNQTDIQMKHFE
ncbi:hypothetical protein OHJ21_19785 [Virgibacillus sp. LDC1]|uniref:hypothetical protein n=1 Tax=unclassified Paenibacillus TaxID=185978 RepID=UPI000CA96E1A|nr:hypothetical protein [Paenibacillus sp. GM2FR]MCV4233429.1 hypothetical protein [Virgibacillus sp. LDC1]PJN57368.1 hypothetical protein PAEVO_41020 [Paenibacillus sp. GM2FR]